MARIRHLIGTKATVWERGSEAEVPRAIRYGDIAILIRSRTRLPEIESALLKANIPYKITGGIGFYQRQEIYDICNYLQFLVNPEDNVALAGVLRAPFFGISDVELYEISQQPASGSFWEKTQAYAVQRIDESLNHAPNTQYAISEGIPILRQVQDRFYRGRNTRHISPNLPPFQSSPSPLLYAVQTLQQHLEICNRLPISALIRKIVNDTGMIGVLPVGKQGEQKLANYEKLLSVARDFEKSGFTDLFDFLERLNLLIEEEEREGQAETLSTSDAVQVMTIHAAKGLEFPVVILPLMERKFKYDQEPFIDDALGIGFSPLAPEKNYEKSDPTVTKLMRERAKNKIIAEEKRLFYVAVTRARERLILSGTLDGKGNADGWFGWLLDALGISGVPAEAQIECPVTIEALKGDEITHISFDLPIRIIKSLDALDFVEEDTSAPPPPIEFPAFHIDPLRPSPAGETFSVTDLLTDAHCPTKFYLKHRLGMPAPLPTSPPSPPLEGRGERGGVEGEGEMDGEGTARGSAVHKVLAQLRTKADCERDLEASIRASVASTFGAVSVDTVRAHVHHFLNSEIGGMALNAQESNCERHIYAQIGPHILNGIVDRLFKDSEGLWHLIDYKTDAIEPSEIAARVNYYRPQIELYALLIHRLYPEQPVIPMTFFFTHLAEAYPMQLTAEELGGVEKALLKRIEAIQGGVFEKNREHCPLCPYFVNEQCLIS
ncbi:PD-(D/E)XK nuclease family protein [Candidatus Poribacteria bacterium]|nr:PD-(D/E)XK nuclease family protein [Candidatus Poribacteria bacterium]